uniref:Secretory protein n=1 Tax=Acrobeloides nanus TaxID=290746 RepID=A0A914CCU1_9BILA
MDDPIVAGQTYAQIGEVIYQSNNYTLIFINKADNLDKNVYQQMIDIFFNIYPKLVIRFNHNAPKEVTFIIDPSSDDIAYTTNATVFYNPAWFERNPEDVDVVTHEIMHVVQSFTAPGWLTEGIADYVRYKYGVNNMKAGWSLPKFESSQNYTDGYRVTARFLLWLERKGYIDIVEKLDGALRNKSYNHELWDIITGKNVDQLWNGYASESNLMT